MNAPTNHDVRMRGFESRSTVEEAWNWIQAQARPHSSIEIPLGEARGMVTARQLVAPISVPEFDRSAMDGFALRAEETIGAGPYLPIPFEILGTAYPGRPFEGEVRPGTAVQVMTGAPLPRGADAVLPAEFAQISGNQVEALSPLPAGKNIGRQGEDVQAGETVIPEGRVLRPQDLAIIASLGFERVSVIRAPRVRILCTGNEVVHPGKPKNSYQIYDANGTLLDTLVPGDGGIVEQRLLLKDDEELLTEELLRPGADVILISGGSSVGLEDHAPRIVRKHGSLPIHGIAMRPSSPAGLGTVPGAIVCLLPGNPVSCLCAYEFFAGRIIRLLGGRSPEWPHSRFRGELTRKIVSQVGRTDYARVRIVDGRVDPIALSGAAVLMSTVRADGFVVIPESSEGFPPGTMVEVFLYR